MARYRSLLSINNADDQERFLKNASPGQLAYVFPELRQHSNIFVSVGFFNDSTGQKVIRESQEDLALASQYYQRQYGESLSKEDIVKAMMVLGEAYAVYEKIGNRNHASEVFQLLIKYYEDPIKAVERLAYNNYNFYTLFDNEPATKVDTLKYTENGSVLLKPLMLSNINQTYNNRLARYHLPEDLDHLWERYALALNDPYDLVEDQRKNGNNKLYRLMNDLYEDAWDKEGYSKLLRELPNYKDGFDRNNAEMRLSAQANVAKMTADVLPMVIDTYHFSMDEIIGRLALYYGHLGHLALEANERILSRDPSLLTNLDEVGPGEWRIFDKNPVSLPGEKNPYHEGRRHNILSPVSRKFDIEISKAKHEARTQQKKANEREIGALKDKVASLTAANQKYKEYISSTATGFNDLLSASIKQMNNRAQIEASRIAYAACADHIREKLALYGEETHILNGFPTLNGVKQDVKKGRDKEKDHFRGIMLKQEQAENKPDIMQSGRLFCSMLEILEESEKSMLAHMDDVKALRVPEIDQLKEENSLPDTKQDSDSQQAVDHASDQSPKTEEEEPNNKDKESPSPTESPTMG